MPYAEGRTYYDADSHIMETRDFLAPFADPGIRARLRPFEVDLSKHRPSHLPLAGAAGPEAARLRLEDPAAVEDARANLMLYKEWAALGASDPRERSLALDLLGFQRQLVFSTFASSQFADPADLELFYGGARAHNRAIAAFCNGDPRLLAVGMIPLIDPARDARLIDEALAAGCRAILVPKEPRARVSPAHPDFDPVWARLQDAGAPFMLHIGSEGRHMHPPFYNSGIARGEHFVIDGETIQSKDLMTISHAAEAFLNAIILDGVLERFPRLRGGCIELGALWVVSWLRKLDMVQKMFVKAEPHLALPLRASDYVRRQLRFTPYSLEPVGWMIAQAGEELFLFNSDYPHPEGGRNPLKRFEESLASTPEPARERFFSRNFAELMGPRL
jgi:predicted TIM-barrel fold metal-dependent hydrolase